MSDEAVPAATVILLRETPALEVLMIRRHENSSFAGGALVFPGGKVDAGDEDTHWRDHATGLADDTVIARAQIAAIREAFEEAGVLLALGPDGEMLSGAKTLELTPWRERVLENDAAFMDLVVSEKLILNCAPLRLFAHWAPPARLHKRYDTLFFVAPFPATQKIIADGNEATEALWINPGEAVAARERGERKMIFPTIRNVELLALSSTIDEVCDFAARRRIVTVTPEIEMREEGAFLTIPDGLGYPVTEESIERATRG